MTSRRKPARPPERLDPASVGDFRLMHAAAPKKGPSKTSRMEVVIEGGVGAPVVLSVEAWRAILALARASGFPGGHNLDERGGAMKPSEVRALRRAVEQGTRGLLSAASESMSMKVRTRKAVEG